ncbi:MAG: sulfatase-like hydrolase/transferase [Campylobacterota bacterium]|nr:sulfatase-like hydrolase/transferase [Campylobacterota bacterium]
MYNKLPKLIRFLISLFIFEMIIFTLFRLAFFIAFNKYGSDYTTSQICYSFWIGFRFDIQLFAIAFLPILLVGGIKYIGLYKSTFAKYFWLIYIFVVNIGMIVIYIIDFPYYDFFKKMVDSSIIRYFYDIGEAMGMLLEGYPIYSTAFGAMIAFGALFYIVKKIYEKVSNIDEIRFSLKQKIMIYSIFSIIYIFGGYGKFELYPWRWSEAFYSSNNFLSYLASNPVTYFQNTMKNKDVKYDIAKTKKYYDHIADFLEIEDRDPQKLSLARRVTPNHIKEYSFDKPNIIFVLSESLAYCRTDMSGNPLKATPFLNSLAESGLTYERYFTPHPGTARSVFTAMTGLSDVERMKTSSRNPTVVAQHMILNSLEGYKKFYFIGGSLSWGNIRGVVSNVDGIVTREESSYESKRNDVWGISDIDLFIEVNRSLKDEKEPFFAFVQLAGNHSPYTIPDKTYGFEVVVENDKDKLMKHSFDGKVEDYNAQRFMDHSIEHFITEAKKESYFDNTVFIFVGDHGLPKQAKHMHAVEENGLAPLHTPLVIYAPKLIGHQKISYPVSEVDMMATIAGLSGMKYVNSTLGRDILDKDFDKKEHYAYFMSHENNPTINLIGDEFIYSVRSDGTGKKLFKYYYDKKGENLLLEYPKIAKRMDEVCRGIFELTRYTRFHNSSDGVEKYLKAKGI